MTIYKSQNMVSKKKILICLELDFERLSSKIVNK